MPSFIYSPEVRVHVAADGTNLPDYQGNIYDISPDLVQGSLIIRTNGVHTFNFQLQNTQRKYDQVLQPMDRITVEMKRVTWVRVFSGYLNNGPVFSAWPRVLNFSASCTLKRLQFWFWDPGTLAAYNLVTAALSDHKSPTPASGTQNSPVAAGSAPTRLVNAREQLVVKAGSTSPASSAAGLTRSVNGQAPTTPPANPANPPANPATTGQSGSKDAAGTAAASNQQFDDSIKGTVLKLLNDVVGWPQDKVHIGDIPKDWVKLATEVGNLIMQKTDERDMLGDFSQGDQQSTPGIGTDNPNGAIPPGNVLDWCKAGLALAGLPASYAPGLAQQAMHESSGNPHAVQNPGVNDINMRNGNPAKGLLQMIPQTFMAHAVPGHTDIFNPIDNSASAARYALGKFGPGWFATGSQHNKGF